jgi:hypothetical protein
MPWARQLADIPLDGIFRRQIDLRAWDGHTVVGWLEDEFHHFGVTLIHDGGHIRDVRVATPRHPWSTCAGAGVPLRALIGQPLTGRCADAEDALVLRRVAFVSFGRRVNIQRVAVAADLGQGPVCHTFQPERSASAVRMPVAPRRYDATADAMLEHIDRQPW